MPPPPAPSPRRTFSLTGVAHRRRRPGAARVGGDARRASRKSRRTSARSAGACVLIVAFGGLRFLLRAAAWRLCLDPPHRLRLRDAFAAVICGDAIGNLTPLGPLVGEPAKAAFVRGRVALTPALTALAIENLLYTLVGGRDDRGRHGRAARPLPAAARRPRRRRARDRGNVRPLRRRAVDAVAAAGADQPRARQRPAAPETRRSDPADGGGDLHVRLASSTRPSRRSRRRRSASTCSASPRST